MQHVVELMQRVVELMQRVVKLMQRDVLLRICSLLDLLLIVSICCIGVYFCEFIGVTL